MQTNPAVEQNKNIKWSKSPWNQSGCLSIHVDEQFCSSDSTVMFYVITAQVFCEMFK